ncbi:hypothetical protein HN51_060690 [Arachis hypogaea]|nr:uncharacterized protein DS421_13g442090 [Arachis hypogaea]
MAAAIVGGALVSASVQVLLDKIISNEFLDFFRRRKLNVSLLGKMKMKLKTMKIAGLYLLNTHLEQFGAIWSK